MTFPNVKTGDQKPEKPWRGWVSAYQEGAEHVERDEVDDGESAAASHLFPGVVVGLRVTQFARHAG